ncbi:SDR family oxidoreductase [Natronorubrum texcoconense]|uniref:Nucleoside-diphosphate-sugar epimerase n=1 Tax=Natronorubrum texcoconense TaxID=1095776 RepID=A0A1G8XB33_9EURY|nr:SDR family oxidoreductase [Natronorubrum texcoconense]SDJ87085.1 Nucleoside-diphosphate-sugar epimerase [Natronorubrum texcoconense]
MTQTVLIAGAHGQVGQHVTAILGESDHEGKAMVRDDDQVAEMESQGADETVVADLTETVSHALEGCDSIIFAAGSGGNDVYGVDRDGAINLIETAEEAGVDRFVMLSSMGADDPESGPDALEDYLTAKAEADDYLRESALEDTIVRPGELTNDSGIGTIEVGDDIGLDAGDIPREDVARTLVTALEHDELVGETFEILSGDEPIEEALETIAAN